MHDAHHAGDRFIVPRRDDAPDVGVVPVTYTEPIKDEVAEIACSYMRAVIAAREGQHFSLLVDYGMAVVAMLKERAQADMDSTGVPASLLTPIRLTREQRFKIVAAELGRFWDWMCKGRRVLDMGPRAFVIASHFRRSAVDGRTDQQAALEIGNDSRASINKIKADFRRMFGADYPGENGKGSNTKTKCKNSRIAQLLN